MSELKQTIRYCKAPDGRAIAWSTMGSGPPVICCALLAHLEMDLQSVAIRPWLRQLALGSTIIRFDPRGTGLSDRDGDSVGHESLVADLEAVVDAAGYPNFSLLAVNYGTQMAVSYAARHPERVRRLVTYGGFARGLLHRQPSAAQVAMREASLAAIAAGWDDPIPAYRMMFATEILPRGSREEQESFAELWRATCNGAQAVKAMRVQAQTDVSQEATALRCPALVLHARQDLRIPFEEGRRLASMIAGARFVPVESYNNIAMPSEPAFDQVMVEIRKFLADGQHGNADAAALATLTPREHAVLELIAQGKDNLQIAAHLGLSEKTVRNHITPIFDKLQVESRAQAIVKAREAGLGKGKPAP